MTNPHDHVLPVYGICTDTPDGKVRLVMNYCEKGSLDALLRHHAFPEVRARFCFRALCTCVVRAVLSVRGVLARTCPCPSASTYT
jgi:hypothetical protein